jgi:hypothetical protein
MLKFVGKVRLTASRRRQLFIGSAMPLPLAFKRRNFCVSAYVRVDGKGIK